MQRWHLTISLSAAAFLAALVVPERIDSVDEPAPPPQVAAPAVQAPSETISGLDVSAALSNAAVPAAESSERYVVVTLDGTSATASADRPINIAVVLDRSGSMGAQSKMSYAKQAARELVGALEANDRFALVTFADRAEVSVPSAPVLSTSALSRSIYAVQEGGGTNLYAGLEAGFDQTSAGLSEDSLSRVILLSDGNANVGITDEDQLAELSGRWIEEGVSLSTMGVGLDYNEDLLAAMADRGGGSYRFIDNPSTLSAVFSDELQRLASVSARGVSVTLEPAPGVELLDVLGYDEELSDGAARVRVGDVREGESRKVVIKLRVPAGSADTQIGVLSVAVSTIDGDLAGPFTLSAQALSDRAMVLASENDNLAVLAAQAEASVLAEGATRAYQRGDHQQMKSLLQASQSVAHEAAERYDSQLLRSQVDVLKTLGYTFNQTDAGSSDGVFQVKRAKEAYRASSR